MSRRWWALASLLLALAAVVLAVVTAVRHFPRGLSVLACLVIALWVLWLGVQRRGALRNLALAATGVFIVAAVVLVILQGSLLDNVLVIGTFVIAVFAARMAFRASVELPTMPRPANPVIFYNPEVRGREGRALPPRRRGRTRGIEPIELTLGTISSSSCATRWRGRGRARDGRRRRLAGDRRGGRRRARPALRVHPGRDAQPLRARPRRGSRRRRRRARRVRRRRRAPRRPRRGQRPRVRQQRLARHLRRGRPAPGTAARSSRRCSNRADVLGPRRAARAPLAGSARAESGTAILVSNNVYRLGRALGSGTRPRLDSGRLGSRCSARAPGDEPARAGAAAPQRGDHRRSR